jgi:DNA-binding beta-propeller fold protein YncE
MNTKFYILLMLAIGLAGCGGAPDEPDPAQGELPEGAYRSPMDVEFSPDGELLAVSDHTAEALITLDAFGRIKATTRLAARPMGVAWSTDSKSIFVAEHLAGSVAEVSSSGKVVRRFSDAIRPTGLAVARKKELLLVADSAEHYVCLVSLASGKQIARRRVVREPRYIAVSPDESLAVVGNRLPAGSAGDPLMSAAISLVSLESDGAVTNIKLPPNSVNVLGVAVSPDGRWAYAAHNLARTLLPTEQIEYGWISANAVSIINLQAKKHYATVLIDRTWLGAANPWGLAISPDGSNLWIACSGVHEVGRLDLTKLHKWLVLQRAELGDDGRGAFDSDEGPVRGAAVYVGASPPDETSTRQVELVVGRLPAQYGAGVYLHNVMAWLELEGRGPRGLAISPDGSQLAAAMYFSGDVTMINAKTSEVTRSVALGFQLPANDVRRGEEIFHDATYCYEQWLSCATCHPDARVDGLNWDLLNDGIGTPKNTRSMLLSHKTPPVMSEAVRADMETATASGFRYIQFHQAPEADLDDVRAYLRSLTAEPSPWLVAGKLSPLALRGKTIFESEKSKCSLCHPGPLFTNLEAYNVGTQIDTDRTGLFDTPTLIEQWRSTPYLHHGRAATLREVLTKFNLRDRHGRTSHLSPEELDALVEYLKSL